jgi:alpha-glucosidase
LEIKPHHDGSELYVSNAAPKIGDFVTLKVRVPKILDIKSVHIRIMQDGEPTTYPLKISQKNRVESWWRVRVEIKNQKTNYRFLLASKSSIQWLNAEGIFDRDITDHGDFKLVATTIAPKWLSSAIFYQIFPDRFAKSDIKRELPDWAIPRNWSEEPALKQSEVSQEFYGGDFVGVREKLKHLKELGVSGIYFTPFFPSKSNHRYDASSFDEVDPLLGGTDALIDLRRSAESLGIRVMGDLTTNHCGLGHSWIQEALVNKTSSKRDFFYWSEKSRWGYVGWWDVPSLPKLNYSSKELRKEMWEAESSIVRKWLREPLGMCGWRIDVGNMTGRYYGENHNREVAFGIRSAMEEVNPDAWLVAENADFYSEDLDGLGWHGTMNYSGFTKPIWYWMNGKSKELKESFGGPVALPKISGKKMVETMREFSSGIPWRSLVASMILLGSHDRARFQTVVGKDPAKNLSGVALLLTYPGVPSIYAGDEIGLEGRWGENGRRTINWENKSAWKTELLDGYKRLIKIRNSSHALKFGGLRWVAIEDDYIAYLRESKRETVLVFASRTGVNAKIDLSKYGYTVKKNLFGSAQSGKTIRIRSKKATSGIWSLK